MAAAYSVNRGLWGVTIGGKETLTSGDTIPDQAWVLTKRRLYLSHAHWSVTRHRVRPVACPPAVDGKAFVAG